MINKPVVLKKLEKLIDDYNQLFLSEQRQFEEKLKLVEENQELKAQINSGSITIVRCPKCNEKLIINQGREVVLEREQRIEIQERLEKAIELMEKWGHTVAKEQYIEEKQYIEYQKIMKVLKGEIK